MECSRTQRAYFVKRSVGLANVGPRYSVLEQMLRLPTAGGKPSRPPIVCRQRESNCWRRHFRQPCLREKAGLGWVKSLGFSSQSCPKLPEVTLPKSDSPYFHKLLNKKPSDWFQRVSNWVQGLDLNQLQRFCNSAWTQQLPSSMLAPPHK